MQIGLRLFGREMTLSTKALPPMRPITSTGGWYPLIRESFTGAWQRNVTIEAGTVLAYHAVYACISLISGDIAKLCLRLVKQEESGIWTETESPAFSPVLRKPNRYQTITKFIEQWLISKLTRGNTYVLKQRDNRRIVTALYVLDPTRVTPMVTQDGGVYYQIKRDDLSGIPVEQLTIPASEIMHDIMCALFHPLIGVSPIYACGTAALQGLSIQRNSQNFFTAGSNPSGILTAPGAISDTTAQRLKEYWETNIASNPGSTAVVGDGLKYEQLSMSAVDAQLIDQLKWTADVVCSCFHVPPYMIGIGPPPPYANIEPLLQQYYAQCIQTLIVSLEKCLDEGLGIDVKIEGTQYGTEFDIDDLIWMDTATRTKAASDSIGSGGMSPNEARQKYFALGPVAGGDTPYMQAQYWPLAKLADRDIPEIPEQPGDEAEPEDEPEEQADEENEDEDREPVDLAASFASIVHRKALETGLYHG